MALSTRFQPIDKNFLFEPGGGLSPGEISAQLADFARQNIAEIDAANARSAGRPIPRQTFVDGARSENLASVKPNGVIVAEWQLGNDVVAYVFDQIRAAAPVLKGRFRDSQRIYADGAEVATPEAAAGASEVVIASTVPYARKIEGRGGPRKEWADNQAGIYHAVAALAAAKYGNIARIKFTVRDIVGGGTDLSLWAASDSARALARRVRGGRADRHTEWLTRQPAVVITFN